MKASVWIPSGFAFLAGIGCAGAVVSGLGSSGDAGQQLAAETVEFTPPPAETRIGVAYSRHGDGSFSSVSVATVKPFDHGVPSVEIKTATPVPSTSIGQKPALLLKVAAKGSEAAAAKFLVNAATVSEDSAILPSTWQSQYFADNPLVGSVFGADGRPSSEDALMGAAKGARYLLLGEIHDNPDHHRIQAGIVDGLVDAGETPAVVFEMIPQSFADTLDGFEASADKNLSALATDLEWSERGWPDFSIYRPIFEAAIRGDLSLKAGDLDKSMIGAIGRDGLNALSPQDVARLSIGEPLSAEETSALSGEIKAAHCGLMPEGAIAPMALVQRARNGSLADAMVDATDEGGESVLITGSGHARSDRGVPAVLGKIDPHGESVAVQMVEVGENESAAADYGLTGTTPVPYDFTIFTPRADITDHCAELRKQMEASAQ